MAESLKSDKYFDNSCTKCDRKHRNTEATWYCPNCDDYFCDACKKLHDEFTRHHVVLDKTKADLWGVATAGDIEQCADHPGQAITMFCGQHEALCCQVCSTLEHSSCDAKAFIPNLVNDAEYAKKSEALMDDITALKHKLVELKEGLNNKQSSLDDSQTKFRIDLHCYQEQVQSALAVQIKTATDKMELVNCRNLEEIKSDLDTCDALSAMLHDMLMKLSETKSTPDHIHLFIDMKNASEMNLCCRDKLNRMNPLANYDIKWSEDKNVLECIENATHIVNTYKAPAPGNSRPIKRLANFQLYNIRSQHDKKACDIQGMCQLLGGTIILSDRANSNLKRLDSDYQVTEVCELQFYPGDLCRTGRREFAVALGRQRQIMFVSITDKMRVVQTLTFDLICHNIAFYDDTLYIENGWGNCNAYRIIKANNEMVSTKLQETSPCVTKAITTSGHGEYIYIVGIAEELYIFDKTLSYAAKVKHPSLGTYGDKCVCVDMNGNVFVSHKSKDRILVFKNHGLEECGKLYTGDKLDWPIVIMVDSVQSRLLVQNSSLFQGCDEICVWDIVYGE